MIDNKRIYGYMDKMAPTTISWASYKTNKLNLLEVPYDAESLKLKTGKDFVLGIRFTFPELLILDGVLIKKLAAYLDIPIIETRHKLINKIKLKLRDY